MPFHLVTGASSGIGEAVADLLLERGHSVLALSRTPGRLATHHRYYWQQHDLSSDHLDPAVLLGGGWVLDGILINAGLNERHADQWSDDGSFRRHLAVNFIGHAALLRTLVTLDKLNPAGCNIVGVGSFLEKRSGRFPAYAASKAALGVLLRSLAQRWETEGLPHNVNVVYPGRVNTPGNPKRKVPPGEVAFVEPREVAPLLAELLLLEPRSKTGLTMDLGAL